MFYLPRYGFSVRKHNGEWVLVCRQPTDAIATTPEQIAAVESWAARNRVKYRSPPSG
jgi:hypothetical protein